MYLRSEALVAAIRVLAERVHPFIGITFLACKAFNLSVGRPDDVSLDGLTGRHLDKYHAIDRKSQHYFQPFKSASRWVKPRYASTGLQTQNTQTFGEVFIHPRRSSLWGFHDQYVARMSDRLRSLDQAVPVPVGALAAWIYKFEDLGSVATAAELSARFLKDFNINIQEYNALFAQGDRSLEDLGVDLFGPEPLTISDVLGQFEPPPDAQLELGRSLSALTIQGAGPAPSLSMTFGERLTLVTGDNGLGKSFLLEFAWWAATGNWASRPMLPNSSVSEGATVRYDLRTPTQRLISTGASFDRRRGVWSKPASAATVEALGLFARADGSFAISDPMRSGYQHDPGKWGTLTAAEAWNGQGGVTEGLIRDWVRWRQSDSLSFDRLAAVLRRLSPEDLGSLEPGETVRILGDPRDIPTIKHRYGTVPVLHASSGVQRVLLLAYLIIWAWREHELAADQLGLTALRRMVVIVDELEAHLHPKWQRMVLPAMMTIGDLLSSELSIQVIAASHSPMILASLETIFNPNDDQLYHLFADQGRVYLEDVPFVKYGDASSWLMSPLFGLRHARSREGEKAIEEAKALQEEDDPDPQQIQRVTDDLRKYLPSDDRFWPRWLFFAERNGVVI